MGGILFYGSRHKHLLATPLNWFWQHLKWLPLIAALFVVVAFGMRHGIYMLLGERYTHAPWLQIYLYEMVKLALFLGLWLGVLFGILSFLAWREQQARIHAMQRALTGAQLQQLQARLQPHFLFNTLNTISAFMHTDVVRADRLLNQLADLLRASLMLGERQTVALAEELQLLHLYADIMTERFAPRVQISWQIADESLAIPIPGLLLQPLLENAFRHGVEQALEITYITIRSQCVAGWLHVSISNSHSRTSTSAGPGTGVGLRNCRERLQAIYGGSASLNLLRSVDRVEAVVVLPELAP
jgi:two-component system, LytTR family, sensor kinase